ncbi:hypothetical protein [Salinirussus salinus]|jgi:hypothetical protein|uniref:hypothetical protein n=1 Tax=Salinirussus salinus TaxID=1198300 RepID=UPI00135CABDC|nr:hypothetical protein [Salinirussus salinus]
MDWTAETVRATAVLVAASALLVGLGMGGVGGSATLAAVLLGAGAGLFAARDWLAGLPVVVGHDLGFYGEAVWLAPVAAAGATLLAVGATAAELQAIGGLVGLAGMVNYFLRPVYHVFARLGRYATRVAG